VGDGRWEMVSFDHHSHPYHHPHTILTILELDVNLKLKLEQVLVLESTDTHTSSATHSFRDAGLIRRLFFRSFLSKALCLNLIWVLYMRLSQIPSFEGFMTAC
jgi:hypothetical protein